MSTLNVIRIKIITIVPKEELIRGKVESWRQEIDALLRVGASLTGAEEMRIKEDRVAERETAGTGISTVVIENKWDIPLNRKLNARCASGEVPAPDPLAFPRSEILFPGRRNIRILT